MIKDAKSPIPTKNLYRKIADAKAEFGPILKNKTNPHFKSAYADLGAILETIEPILYKHGLLLTQQIVDETVTSQITDVDCAENMTSCLAIPDGLDAQKKGAAISYFRRFTLQSLLALHAEDNDAEEVRRPEPYKAQTLPIKPMDPNGLAGVYVPKKQTATYDTLHQTPAHPPKVFPVNKPKALPNSDYMPTFGKYAGKKLGDIGLDSLAGYMKYLTSEPSKMSSGAITLVEKIKEHLAAAAGNTQVEMNPPPHDDRDSIPF
jgi:hypothetical protein